MTGTSGNEDGNVGPFYAPACPGHRGHFGGEKTPPPTVPLCNMLVPWRTLNGRHLTTPQCARGAERKRRRLAEEELRKSMEKAFQAYGETLENVTAFRYLVQAMTLGDDDWPAVVGNLQRARGKKCGRTA